jgi:non-heme chloroperoxidase
MSFSDLDLEVLTHLPATKAKKKHATPLLFIHGAYTGAWCWDEYFLPWFAQQGWTAYALSLSGHGKSRSQGYLDMLSLNDYVTDVESVISRLPAAPVLIGHSMGGMVVQKYLEQAAAPAAVLLSSVPPQGLASSAIGLMMSSPHLLTDLNNLMSGGNVNAENLREALFSQPIEPERLLRYLNLSQRESMRALWDMTLFNLPNPAQMHDVPLLVLGAEHDRLISPAQVEMTASTYGVKAEIFPDLGHGMMLETDWENVARRIEGWLNEQKL